MEQSCAEVRGFVPCAAQTSQLEEVAESPNSTPVRPHTSNELSAGSPAFGMAEILMNARSINELL